MQWVLFRSSHRRCAIKMLRKISQYSLENTYVISSLSYIIVQPKKIVASEIVYKKSDDWYIEWQRVTTNDNEWKRVTANDNERQRVKRTGDSEWQWVTANAKSGATDENK